MKDQDSPEIILEGIGGSPGICIGKAYLVDKEGVDVVKQYVVREESLPAEVGRFKTAVKKAAESLRDLRIAEVVEMDIQIENGEIVAFRTKLNLSFKYQD